MQATESWFCGDWGITKPVLSPYRPPTLSDCEKFYPVAWPRVPAHTRDWVTFSYLDDRGREIAKGNLEIGLAGKMLYAITMDTERGKPLFVFSE